MMLRAGGLIFAFCGALLPHTSLAWQLQASLCHEGSSFAPDHVLYSPDGLTCGRALSMYFQSYINHTSFTEFECYEMIDEYASVGMALTLLSTRGCCAGAPVPEMGMCGPNYYPDVICREPHDFNPGAEVDQHCSGDEAQPEEVCTMAGEEAWDPMAEENCDVGRIPGLQYPDEFAAKCHLVGGIWESRNCAYMAAYVGREVTERNICQFSWMGERCCGAGERAQSDAMCGGQPMGTCLPLDVGTKAMLQGNGWNPVPC